MKKIILISLFAMLSIGGILAQTGSAIIKGHVLDGETDEHLAGVVVQIEGTTNAIHTDDTGHFRLKGVSKGTYILTTQYIGYKVTRQEVKVKQDGGTTNISIYIYPEAQQLQEVSIVGSMQELNRKMDPVVINQITPEMFEATNSTSLARVLNYLPGLRVENNCQNCGTQEVRINGLKGEYSQILMDGQPIFSSLSQIYGLEQMPTNMIEKVEVVRGGGSVLYGTGAIGGVLNIVSKEPEKNSYEVKYNLSMIDGKRADHNVGLNTSLVDKTKTSGISIFANMRERNPWDANKDGFSEIGKMKSKSIGMRSFTKTSLRDKFTLEYHHISDFRRGGDQINKPAHESMITESTDYSINSGNIGYSHFSRDRKQKLIISGAVQNIRRSSYYGEGGDPDGYGRTSEFAYTATVRYELNMDKLLFMPSKLTVGFTQDYSNLTDTIHSRRIKQLTNISSLYAQNEWRNDNLTFIVGVRADKHNRLSKINVIPRTSARYKLNDKINLRATYSMGYRAPEITASDLDVPISGGQATIMRLGENLKREYSHTINGGADFTFFNEHVYSYFLVEGFYTKINRVFIEEQGPDDDKGNKIIMKRNGDGASVYGVNLETNFQPISWIDLQGGFTWQRSKYTEAVSWSDEDYVAPVKRMLRSPNTYGFATITATPHKKYSVSLSGVYTGSMLAPHFAGGEGVEKDKTEKTKSFFDTTLKLSYFFNINPTNKVELTAGIQNMFDQRQKDYDRGPGRDSEYIYGPTLPRTYFIGFKLSSL